MARRPTPVQPLGAHGAAHGSFALGSGQRAARCLVAAMSKAKAKALERAQRLANEGITFSPAVVAEEVDALQGAGAA